jgi:hypothetical protein
MQRFGVDRSPYYQIAHDGQGRDVRGDAPSADLGSAGRCPARLGLLAVMPLVIVAVVAAYMAGQGSR